MPPAEPQALWTRRAQRDLREIALFSGGTEILRVLHERRDTAGAFNPRLPER